MRALIVGDPHATLEELDDCRNLVDFVAEVAQQQEVDRIILLGDLYHTHSVMRVEVMAFWRHSLGMLAGVCPTIALVGNHDLPGTGGDPYVHALAAHEDQVEVVDCSTVINGVLYMPYTHDAQEFINICQKYPTIGTVICHQTFDGSVFENGFHAPDGIDPEQIPQKHIISGHIHAGQSFSKIWYPGAPRWRTLTDANSERAIWVVEFRDGVPVSKIPYDTGDVCRQIRYSRIDVDTGEVVDGVQPILIDGRLDPSMSWRIDLHGSGNAVDAAHALYAAPGVRIRTFINDGAPVKVRESEGVQVAFGRYLEAFEARHGTDPAILRKMAQERLQWM